MTGGWFVANLFQHRDVSAPARAAVSALLAVACAILGATLGGPLASAQSAPPDPAKLIEALKEKSLRGAQPARTQAAAADSERARLIMQLKAKATRGLSVEERTQLSTIVAEKPAVDLEVFFALDSAAIDARAKPTLDALGKALQDESLKGRTVLVAGHTDASGSRPHNQALSERRAVAVKDYLAKSFGIAPDMLMSVGYGPERLKKPDRPMDGANRRVEIVNLGR